MTSNKKLTANRQPGNINRRQKKKKKVLNKNLLPLARVLGKEQPRRTENFQKTAQLYQTPQKTLGPHSNIVQRRPRTAQTFLPLSDYNVTLQFFYQNGVREDQDGLSSLLGNKEAPFHHINGDLVENMDFTLQLAVMRCFLILGWCQRKLSREQGLSSLLSCNKSIPSC